MKKLIKASVRNLEDLAGCGFTSEECATLLQLQYRYQTRASDRFLIARHWEFLRFLVQTGRFSPIGDAPTYT